MASPASVQINFDEYINEESYADEVGSPAPVWPFGDWSSLPAGQVAVTVNPLDVLKDPAHDFLFSLEHDEAFVTRSNAIRAGHDNRRSSLLTVAPPDAIYSCGVKCGWPDSGEMIQCDGVHDEWYHLGCVGLATAPKNDWYCDLCSPVPTASRSSRATSSVSTTSSFVTASETTSSRSTKYPIIKAKSWSEAEDAACIALMKDVCQDSVFKEGEKRFDEISRRLLHEYGIMRSRSSVKMQWGRRLRLLSGFDDRSGKQRSKAMVTSALNKGKSAKPKSKKRARAVKRWIETGDEQSKRVECKPVGKKPKCLSQNGNEGKDEQEDVSL